MVPSQPWVGAWRGTSGATQHESGARCLEPEPEPEPEDLNMSDTGGGSASSPMPGMSDSEGAVVGARTTSVSGMSQTSGPSRTSLSGPASTTTISTIAVQSGDTRIVLALLQVGAAAAAAH